MSQSVLTFLNARVWQNGRFTQPGPFSVVDGKIAGHHARYSEGMEGVCIDLEGGYIIPGITDIHTHADFTASDARSCDYALRQGVTRQVSGLCGFHPVYDSSIPKEDYIRYTGFLGDIAMLDTDWHRFFNRLNAGCPVTRYQLFGLNSFLYSFPLDSDEVIETRIDQVLEQYNALEGEADPSRCFHGFSLSLNYHPVKSLPAERLYRFMNGLLCKMPVCCSYHVRDQKDKILESIQEVMAWHEGTGARCHISHLKFGGASHEGQFPARYEVLKNWQQESAFPLSWDTYPFAFASSTITSFFPTTDFWQEKSEAEFIGWLKQNPPPKLPLTTIVCENPAYNGKLLGQISEEIGECIEKALLVICRDLNGGGTYQRDFCLPEDLNWLLNQPETYIASDSFGLGQVHPRNTDTFTTVLHRAWMYSEQTLTDMVARLVEGSLEVFPTLPVATLETALPAELFYFTPVKGNQAAFSKRGTIVGKQHFCFG